MKLEETRLLWQETRGERLRYLAAIAALWLAIVASFVTPLVLLVALDALAGDPSAPGSSWLSGLALELRAEHGIRAVLVGAALLVVLLTALAGGFQYLRGRWAAQAAEALVHRLRVRLFEHLHRLPLAFLDRADTGDLVQRCTSDVETLRTFLATQVVDIGRAVLLVLTALPLALWLDLRMGLVSVALHPVIAVFAFRYFRSLQALFRAVDEAEASMTTVLQEDLTGVRVVRAFGREREECARFAEKNARHRDHLRRWIESLATYWAISDFLCVLQLGLVLFAGGHWLARGELSLGTLYAFLALEGLVVWPVRQLGRSLSETGKALVAIERLAAILGEAEEPRGAATTCGSSRAAGELLCRDLAFAHGDGEEVLRGVDLRVRPGETVALLGPPGAGKSTLFALGLGLYKGYHGSLLLDGREVAELDPSELRRHVGIVFQEPFHYSRSVLANLLLAQPEASAEEVEAAARDADVHATFQGLADGYHTEIGERGVTLSGGQRQRLALARAFLQDPPLLLLDDALSAVDTDTEARILAAVARRRAGRTTLIATHRLSVVPYVDRVVVLEAGRVAQDGTHAELVARPGTYRDLWHLHVSHQPPGVADAPTPQETSP